PSASASIRTRTTARSPIRLYSSDTQLASPCSSSFAFFRLNAMKGSQMRSDGIPALLERGGVMLGAGSRSDVSFRSGEIALRHQLQKMLPRMARLQQPRSDPA
ncbi:MAG: hypothetical protein N2651_09495, partial [Fimbriimonadales bacterium]|nr:hypothetical protein [Fimbriimonadales bacterium]